MTEVPEGNRGKTRKKKYQRVNYHLKNIMRATSLPKFQAKIYEKTTKQIIIRSQYTCTQ